MLNRVSKATGPVYDSIKKYSAKELRLNVDFAISMLKEIGRLFSYWHAFLDSKSASREELWQATTLIRARMKLRQEAFDEFRHCGIRIHDGDGEHDAGNKDGIHKRS